MDAPALPTPSGDPGYDPGMGYDPYADPSAVATDGSDGSGTQTSFLDVVNGLGGLIKQGSAAYTAITSKQGGGAPVQVPLSAVAPNSPAAPASPATPTKGPGLAQRLATKFAVSVSAIYVGLALAGAVVLYAGYRLIRKKG